MGASFADSFVNGDTAPFERFHDVSFCARHETVRVGVFDAQDEITASLAGEKVVVQRRAYAAHMQRAGGTRGEADSYFAFHIGFSVLCSVNSGENALWNVVRPVGLPGSAVKKRTRAKPLQK